MDTRRDFLKKAALLSGGTGLSGLLPAAIQKALAINPAPGSTYLDAEHVVILMQENRSFDHCYGTLRGVRGFNDPRAIQLPDKNLVWLQTNKEGKTYAPFRLDLKDSKATWMSSLPHTWENQVDARNHGKYDKWLDVKRSGNPAYADLPMTMGYYTREDLPFYYALADAFTICDQNFCSSLTGTTPNRLYFFTGKLRGNDGRPNVRNQECDYGVPGKWTTFPERLEENGISWKIYQNELSVGVGFDGDQDAWLANFTDNPLEFFAQYRPELSAAHYQYVITEIAKLTAAIRDTSLNEAARKEMEGKLTKLKAHEATCRPEIFDRLSERERNLHENAFVTNKKDPDYHTLSTLRYHDGTIEREVKVPKGDVLYQFREDVKKDLLPTVSWLVAPENFSDHPGAPWYGAWYISEVMDILTQNPEVWKKTIFILAYDENDGDFDHVPPFVPPFAAGSGKASKGIDLATEYVTREQELAKEGVEPADVREGPIGLGYRVPLVIASPWSRGGAVCSEVFDHTSTLQFLEQFLQHETGKPIKDTNISAWRRNICGDLTSVFRPYNGEKIAVPDFITRDPFIETIHKAQFRQIPAGFKLLTAAEIAAINKHPADAPHMASQEKGTRTSLALPYELYVDGQLGADKKSFEIKYTAGNERLGKQAAGAPFNVYAHGVLNEKVKTWAYAVAAGDTLSDEYSLQQFENGHYDLRVYGPNGFFRAFKGHTGDPLLDINCRYDHNTGNVSLQLMSHGNYTITIQDNAYKNPPVKKTLSPNGNTMVILDLQRSFSWYDFSVLVQGHEMYEQRYAGRVETGKPGVSDPLMGRTI